MPMKAKTVDAYINSAPKENQSMLKEIRAIIKSAAPNALEKISYGMPYYDYKGRLAYFKLGKGYLGVYIPPPVIQQHKAELKDYAVTNSTLHFLFGKKLPAALIKRIIKAKIKHNLARL
jgi:uncharacterized protein YdhG (YjbR/CyaY superfamily)